MLRIKELIIYIKVSFIGVFAVYSVCAVAQTDEENTPSLDEFGNEVTFTILNEVDRLSYQKEQAQKIKERLASSELAVEHQDLIAEAISKFHGGVPVGSYREETVEESLGEDELFDRVRTVSILDNGFVEVDRSSMTAVRWFDTPFNQLMVPLSLWDLSSGKVLKKTKSNITFRFDEFMEITREGEEFGEAFQTISNYLRRMELVAEVTIDKNSRTVLRYSERLLRSFGKMFVFRVKKLDDVKHYQFLEECACMVVMNEISEFSASAIIAGRWAFHNTTTYSDMKFEKPLRYILPDIDDDDI